MRWKHSAGAGAIHLTTHCQPENDAVLAILIDSGVGITAKDLPHIFEPGFTTKADMASTTLGWGLYAARLIVTSHHGTINVSPAGIEGGGTRVDLVLPLSPRDTA